LEYFLTEQQKLIKSIARRIAEERILPVRAELDEKEQFPWELVQDIANADLFRVFIPEKYEGLGESSFALCIAIEELARACAGVALTYAADALGTIPILLYASEAQKQKYLPAIASGARLTAFGLTESSAGSDAGAMKTTAKREGDEYVLNGTKQFITNGGEAEIYTVIALTNPKKGAWHFYWIYAVERAGSMVGTEWFGDRAWYKEGSEWLLSNQQKNGSWFSKDNEKDESDKVCDTCWAILFLKRATKHIAITYSDSHDKKGSN
jgi:alkylation response protein AidB-like acyl-CoA dehydrogenase